MTVAPIKTLENPADADLLGWKILRALKLRPLTATDLANLLQVSPEIVLRTVRERIPKSVRPLGGPPWTAGVDEGYAGSQAADQPLILTWRGVIQLAPLFRRTPRTALTVRWK